MEAQWHHVSIIGDMKHYLTGAVCVEPQTSAYVGGMLFWLLVFQLCETFQMKLLCFLLHDISLIVSFKDKHKLCYAPSEFKVSDMRESNVSASKELLFSSNILFQVNMLWDFIGETQANLTFSLL